MNLVARQNFGFKANVTTFNTEIGGVSATISTAALLATKLAIDVARISNFTIVGSDIKCRITGSYAIPSNAFLNNLLINNYIDVDGLVTNLGDSCFSGAVNIKVFEFEGIIVLTGNYCFINIESAIILKNCTTITFLPFQYIKKNSIIYIPNVNILGPTTANNNVFLGLEAPCIIYLNPVLQTSNSGGLEGDIITALNQYATIRYVTNFTSPNQVTDLSSGIIYNTSVQTNFTIPISTNAIDYYEYYVNDVFKGIIKNTGYYVADLNSLTNYDIKLIAVDIFYNKSTISNILNVTTNNSTATDSDAISYISTSGNSLYQDIIDKLFIDLKANSLYSIQKALYTFIGTTSAQNKYNAVNPVDSDSAFRLTFNGSATFSKLGYQMDGGSFANTHLTPSINQNVNSNGLTVVCGTNYTNISTAVEIGSFQNPNGTFIAVKRVAGGRKDVFFGNTITQEIGVNESRCILSGVRTASNVIKMYKNGALIATSSAGGSVSTIPFDIGRLSAVNGQYSNQRIQTVAIHEGMTDAQTILFQNIIMDFENALGRKTW